MSHMQSLESENARLQQMLSDQAASQTLKSTQALVAYLDSNYERLPSQLETGNAGMAHVWAVNIEGKADSQGMLLFTERDVECLGSPVSGEQGLALTAMQAMLCRSKTECERLKDRTQHLLVRNRESDQRLLDLQQPKHEIGDMVGKLIKQEKAMVMLRAENEDLGQEIEASKMVKQQLAEQNAVLQRDNWELHQKLEQLGADWAHPRQ
eukprot:TRINITY_DN2798_c0_g1_i2.p1 TRINITY_DN2798_c0_g1~~TRINITY_DN2798_c0_g1_i2.p1  ORF type:complete len:209 (-),score=59.29 TRINITY_DN2798_c0_g1_i2:86-712(-)